MKREGQRFVFKAPKERPTQQDLRQDPREEPETKKIKPLEVVTAHLPPAVYAHNWLSSHPGFVNYDPKKHDISDTSIPHKTDSWEGADWTATFVKIY